MKQYVLQKKAYIGGLIRKKGEIVSYDGKKVPAWMEEVKKEKEPKK